MNQSWYATQTKTDMFDVILKNNSTKINEYKQLDWFILMPYFRSLSDQTASRVKEWITQIRTKQETEGVDHSDFMKNVVPNQSRSYLSDHVIRLGTGAKDQAGKKKQKNENEKFKEMVSKIKKEENTMFIVVVDEAHFGANEASEFSGFFNQPNFDELLRIQRAVVIPIAASDCSCHAYQNCVQ